MGKNPLDFGLLPLISFHFEINSFELLLSSKTETS